MINFLVSYTTIHNAFNLVNITASTEEEALTVVNNWKEVLKAEIQE